MPSTPLQDRAPFAGHSPGQPRPLAGYGVLTATFLSLCGAFAARRRSAGAELPERAPASDLALLSVATHKLARLIARDRVTSAVRAPFTTFQGDHGPGEVDEAARGHGLRRAVGELLVCPYCLDMWVATAFVCGLIAAPRVTRWIAATFTVLTGSDVLQIAYARAAATL